MYRIMLTVALLVCLGATQAETLKGRIAVVSKQAGTIQLEVKGKDKTISKVVVRTDANTRFEGATELAELSPPDLIEVQREPGRPASRVKKIVFGLPPGIEIGIEEMVGIMTRGAPYAMYDARPAKRFGGGHIPGAKSAHPNDDDFLDRLPADKDLLLVFYCGGPTCPYTGIAVTKAQAAGYTNVRGFQAGLPGWKKAKLPVHAEPAWLSTRLNPQHVILDVRDTAQSSQAHIVGAVALPSSRLQAMRQGFVEQQQIAQLPGVSDMRAPVILYANDHTSATVLLAFKELRSWGYKGITILRDGFDGWRAAGLPVASGAADTEIVYHKKLAPGAIDPEEFIALQRSGDGVILVDVRTDAEVVDGIITGARHLPLEELEDRLGELPADQEVLLYCANGVRAEMAHEILRQRGIKSRYLNEAVVVGGDGGFRL